MQITIQPDRNIDGVIMAPPSKSMAHRAVLCAALAKGTSHIRNLEFSKDIAATLAAYAIGLAARLLLLRRRFPIPLALPDLLKSLAACALMLAVLGAVSWPPTLAGLLAAIGLGVACYGAAALALNVSGARRLLPIRWFRRGTA